jgi:uncharacterized protein (DUF1697 family)
MIKTYISILRGINVGGQKSIKMELLKVLYAKMGFANVQTYIQSGNVVFCSNGGLQIASMQKKIMQEIQNTFDFEVPVLIFEATDFEKIIKNNPYLKDTTKHNNYLHLTFLSESQNENHLPQIEKATNQAEDFAIIDKVVYLYCPNGYSNCKWTNAFWERKLKCTATTRNLKTAQQLLQMAQSLEK